MPRKPKPNAAEYLRRVLNIPITRPMTGHEIQRLDFAEALLVFIIKGRITRKEMAVFIKSYAQDNGILPKVCYTALKKLKDQTIIKYDDFYKTYHYNHERYKRDHKALAAFQRQVRAWSNTSEDLRNHPPSGQYPAVRERSD